MKTAKDRKKVKQPGIAFPNVPRKGSWRARGGKHPANVTIHQRLGDTPLADHVQDIQRGKVKP